MFVMLVRKFFLLAVSAIIATLYYINFIHSQSPYLKYLSRLSSFYRSSNSPRPPSSASKGQLLFKEKQLVIWSTDYHTAPIHDIKHLLQPLGVHFIDKSLAEPCHLTNSCHGKTTLRVLSKLNTHWKSSYFNPDLIPQFFAAYKDDPEMSSVDAFACFHPAAMCEIFAPFNKSLLIIAPIRFESGRRGKESWMRWNDNLKQYAMDKKNLIAGNSVYDAEYIKYFTGVPAQYLPSFCGYTNESYSPTRPGFLLAPMRNPKVEKVFFDQYRKLHEKRNHTINIIKLKVAYKNYKYSDVAAHRGIIYVPYQVSVMSFFEQYRMNIPLFCPSLTLLTTWQIKYMAMNKRTWVGVFGGRPAGSIIPPHPSQVGIPDPNDERNETAIKYWIKFSDYYQFPNVIYYDSVEHLTNLLSTVSAHNN